MEDLILTSREHKVLKNFQKRLQRRYNVKIHMPTVVTSGESDVVFVSINGEAHNREHVKKFLSEKMNRAPKKADCKENVIIITLSDSEEEPMSNVDDNTVTNVDGHSYSENCPDLVDELTVVNSLENSSCIIETPIVSESSSHSKRNISDNSTDYEERKCNPLDHSVCIIETPNPLDNSVYIIDSPITLDSLSKVCKSTRNNDKDKSGDGKINRVNKNASSKGVLPFSQPSEKAEKCEVSSTTEEVMPKKGKLPEVPGILTEELTEFIPLQKKRKFCYEKTKLSKKGRKDDVIVLDELSSAIRPLRPVVIDGSNVAFEHGKVSNCFSAKGIQIAINYFLDRGHTQVTAFVPKFRRFCNRKNFPTTDSEILDNLATKQHVVFTPSRRINGKCVASYDDRFIVQLASTNGGVIVSNDNYRDLIAENDSFKEVIENRLLMFCFVGDIFMIPSDPLGRDGPPLNEFLSFPPAAKT